MKKEPNNFLFSRLPNVVGDVFYYFVITIVVYRLNSTLFVMSLLSLAYLVPGLIGSQLLKKWVVYKNQKEVLIRSDITRLCALIMISVSHDWKIILIGVFIEQLFSISSIAAFNQLVASGLEDADIQKLNANILISTNVIRILMLTIYFSIAKLNGKDIDSYFLMINVILTLTSIVLSIKYIPSFVDAQEKQINTNTSSRLIKKDGVYKCMISTIVAFCLICSLRIVCDSYYINYSAEMWDTPVTGFSIYSILTAFAMISAGLIAKKKRILTKDKKTWILLTLLLMVCTIISTNARVQILCLIFLFMANTLINLADVSLVSAISIEAKDLVNSLSLKQTFYYNIVSTTIALIGLTNIKPSIIFRFSIVPVSIAFLITLTTRRITNEKGSCDNPDQ